MQKVESQKGLQSPTYEDVGLCMDTSYPSQTTETEGIVSLDGAAEEVSVASSRSTPTPVGVGYYYQQVPYGPVGYYPACNPVSAYQNYGHPDNLPSPVHGVPHLSSSLEVLQAAAIAAQEAEQKQPNQDQSYHRFPLPGI